MNLQEFSPWNWFKSEGADAPSVEVEPPRRGALVSPIGTARPAS